MASFVVHYVTYLVWIFVRNIHKTLQHLLWQATGTNFKRQKLQYSNQAHLQCIKARYKADHLHQPSGLHNFIAHHQDFVSVNYVFQDNITLYYVTAEEAIFVETDEDIDVTLSDHGSFMKIAQFIHAKKVITMPIKSFYALTDRLEEPSANMIFLSNTSRCGSTLLTHIFEASQCMALCEPDTFQAIYFLKDELNQTSLKKLIQSTTKYLCKPVKKEIKAYVIKITAEAGILMPHVKEIFPNSIHLFMYRGAFACTKSLVRCANAVPYVYFEYLRDRWMPFLRRLMSQKGFSQVKLQSTIQVSAAIWAQSIRSYLEWQSDNNMDIVAVLYEDIVENTEFALQKVFDYCKVPYVHEYVESVFAIDSQRGSPLSQTTVGVLKSHQLMNEFHSQTSEIWKKHGLPDVDHDFVLPNTITRKIC